MNRVENGGMPFDDSTETRAALAFSRLYEEITSLRSSVSALVDQHRSEAPYPLAITFGSGVQQIGDGLVRKTRPPLPDPRLIRRIISQRQLRARYFNGDMFADPAWDMLLDLTAARAEHKRVSVSSLCIASSVPPTTALRWISQMIEEGWLIRIEDETDRRRAFIELSERSVDAMARYFAELSIRAASMV